MRRTGTNPRPRPDLSGQVFSVPGRSEHGLRPVVRAAAAGHDLGMVHAAFVEQIGDGAADAADVDRVEHVARRPARADEARLLQRRRWNDRRDAPSPSRCPISPAGRPVSPSGMSSRINSSRCSCARADRPRGLYFCPLLNYSRTVEMTNTPSSRPDQRCLEMASGGSDAQRDTVGDECRHPGEACRGLQTIRRVLPYLWPDDQPGSSAG